MTADLDTLVAHVAGHAGVPDDTAERAMRAVLAGFGGYLPMSGRRLLADELPHELADTIEAGDSLAIPVEERVLARGASAGQAHELVTAVCRVLAEELSEEALHALRAALPLELGAQLVPPELEAGSPPAEPRRRPTLAGGRPGSEHPVSESAPPGAQHESVENPNPHATTKLSSAEGITQERLHETIAEGEPGFERPLSGSRHH